MRELTDTCRHFLESEEGTVLHVYTDRAGLPTIGIGHLIKKGENFSKGITSEEADNLFKKDLESIIPPIEDCINVGLNDNQFGAIVSFVFNIGLQAFKVSHVLKYLNAGDFEQTKEWMLKWKNITLKDGSREPALLGRRKREIFLFEAPSGS